MKKNHWMVVSVLIIVGITATFVGCTNEMESPQAVTPTISLDSGTYQADQTVQLTTTTADSTIYYTLDGTDPNTSLTRIKYTEEFGIDKSLTLRAVAEKSGWLSSAESTETYTMYVAAPSFSVEEGTPPSARSVEITSATPNVAIYYTTNGTEPSTSSMQYIGAVVVDQSMTLKAIAVKEGCSDSVVASFFEVGDMGPSGGYIFYKNPNHASADWRYLEAAPEGWSGTSTDPSYIFGYYRPEGTNVPVGRTSTEIGTGEANTDALVAAMGDEAYSGSTGSDKAMYYAAKACADYSIVVDTVTYDDWFLPSKDELNQMYLNLKKNSSLGGFSDYNYWSSSELKAYSAWAQNFSSGNQGNVNRSYNFRVRPVRAFL